MCVCGGGGYMFWPSLGWIELDHHAVSTSFLERLWSYFRKEEQPTSRAAIPHEVLNTSSTPVMWPWPPKMPWSLFTVHSLQLHHTFSSQPGYPLPRLRTGVDTCVLPLRHLHCTMWLSFSKGSSRDFSSFAPIFLRLDNFRQNIWGLFSAQFHFWYIFGDQLNMAKCRRPICCRISCNSRRPQERWE